MQSLEAISVTEAQFIRITWQHATVASVSAPMTVNTYASLPYDSHTQSVPTLLLISAPRPQFSRTTLWLVCQLEMGEVPGSLQCKMDTISV